MSRRRLIVAVLTLVVALLAAGFLVVSWRERDEARADLAAARVALRHERALTTTSGTQLASAHRILGPLEQQLPTVAPAATAIATFDDQDLDSVRAAVKAGLAGDFDAYNQAVDDRAGIDPQHDTALEQLRQQANAIITALDQITG